MPDYDPTTVALVGEMLQALAPDPETTSLAYTEQLRRVQAALVEAVQTSAEPPSPEVQQVLMQALGRLDPRAEDRFVAYGEVLRRLLTCVDRELMRWTSAAVQPVGPSGDAVVAPFALPPEEPTGATRQRQRTAAGRGEGKSDA